MPTQLPPAVDWDATGRVVERLIAEDLEEHRAGLHRVPRDALRRRVLDILGEVMAERQGDPHCDERYFECAARALDRALDRYYEPKSTP